MKRDMDRVRSLMLAIENDKRLDGTVIIHPEVGDLGITEDTYRLDAFHLELLIEARLVSGSATTNMPIVKRLTWEETKFLDSVRNPEVWSKTKAGMKAVGGLGLDLIVQLAKAEGKRLITEKLGIPL